MGVCQSTKTESNSVLQTQSSSDLVHNEHWGQKVRGVGEAVIEEHLLSNHQHSVSIPCKSSPHKPFTSLLLALKSETAERFRDNKSLHSTLPAPLAKLVSSIAPAPCTDWATQTRVGSQGSHSLAQHPSQVLSSVSHYLKSVKICHSLQAACGLWDLRIRATLSKHFWQPFPALSRLVRGTPLPRCAEGSRGSRAEQRAGHAGRIWPRNSPSRLSSGHNSAEDTGQQKAVLVAMGKPAEALGLAQLELSSQPTANPRCNTGRESLHSSI